MLQNPPWTSLTTEHAHLAVGDGLARRYPADVVPIAAVVEESRAAWNALGRLLAPEEATYVVLQTQPDLPATLSLTLLAALPCLQMLCESPPNVSKTGGPEITALTAEDAPAMVALTDAAFPGFFRPRTWRMGRYFGIRAAGDPSGPLLAMAGERLALPGMRELSAVCTLPAATGRGLATQLIQHVVALHRSEGLETFLHVAETNARAIALYHHLGFRTERIVTLYHLRRS